MFAWLEFCFGILCLPTDDVITPEDIFDIMEEDVQKADLLLWVGISFEQSASTAYFRRVRQSGRSLQKFNVMSVSALQQAHFTQICTA